MKKTLIFILLIASLAACNKTVYIPIESGRHILFISIEMSAIQLINRILLEDSAINPRHLFSVQMDGEERLDLLIIDYLGLIRTGATFSSRYLEVGYITGDLKNLAKEIDIPVILLSQLNRPIKGAAVREPQLEDLRESRDIEQDADIVLLLHKPDYYNPEAVDANGVSWKNRRKILIAKHCEGVRNSTVIFWHDERYKKIFDETGANTKRLYGGEELPF